MRPARTIFMAAISCLLWLLLIGIGSQAAADAAETHASPPFDIRQCPDTLHGALTEVGVDSNLWTRRFGSHALPSVDPAAAASALAAALAGESGDGSCALIRRTMILGMAWALVDALADKPAARTADTLGLIERAVLALGAKEYACATKNACLLQARFEAARAAWPSREAPSSYCPGGDHRSCAEALAGEVLAISAREGPSLSTAEAWMLLAEIHGGSATDGLAPAEVRNAFATLTSLAELPSDPRRRALAAVLPSEFRHRQLPIYQAATDVAVAELGLGNPALPRLLLDIGEASRRAQIEGSLADACERLEVPLSHRDLLPRETIIYPVVGTARTYLLVAANSGSRTGWSVHPAGPDSGAAALRAVADQLLTDLPRAAAESAKGKAVSKITWRASDAQDLHAQLIAPLIAAGVLNSPADLVVDDPPTLIFFPDPVLRNVPWAILHPADKPGAYLLRDAAIAIAPGLAYIRPPRALRGRGPMLAGGFDANGNEGLETFVKSLGKSNFRKHISASLPGPDFTRTGLESALAKGDYRVVLLATHAKFGPSDSKIYVHAERDPEIGECDAPEEPEENVPRAKGCGFDVGAIESSLRTAQRKSTGLDLLILMACEGAVGDAGDLGIAGAALRGGARATIGTLTGVEAKYARYYFHHPQRSPREGTSFLARFFDEGDSPVMALRRAQLANATGDFGFPPNWGVYVVVGNWR